ncbi:hypothetical protein FNV43_RR08486 [Rhamnella rubrinervis]|uniref:Uncharacterized protein n=1 Tax=Rhamnella rubrinervis TaxID=2594499 RepID=A0A8K0H8B4_9ROSA|nr:hypothetical protein FNV43_RR08486 [Rhamnella rubrinervis]
MPPPKDKGRKDRYFFVSRSGLCDWHVSDRNPPLDRKSAVMPYLYDAAIKVDKAFKKKAEAYINAAPIKRLKKTTSTKQTAWRPQKWVESTGKEVVRGHQKLIEKDSGAGSPRLTTPSQRGEGRQSQWWRHGLEPKAHLQEGTIDAILKTPTTRSYASRPGRRRSGHPTPNDLI